MAGTKTLNGEPPRSTAYYYADLERLKRNDVIKSEPIRTLDRPTRRNQPIMEHSVRSLDQPLYEQVGMDQSVRSFDQPIRDHDRSFDQPIRSLDLDRNDGPMREFHSPVTRKRNFEPIRGLERNFDQPIRAFENVSSPIAEKRNLNELSEYVESNEIINDVPIREVPPLRDRQWSLPEYHTPENSRKIETYSTAGTFPMPEPKEKEPLLAELEVVGRLPLTQLETSVGVRRSRSWYLCCPNVPEEEISRESSWRYSSLRPITAPPLPQNGLHHLVATASSACEDVASLRAERDSLARALAAERARAASQARAHDARLAELHGVIAELVRRRAADKQARAIPEEEVSDECESTTQPAGELDNDNDRSRTEQNDTSSLASPAELPTPQGRQDPAELPDDTDTSTQDPHTGIPSAPQVEPPSESSSPPPPSDHLAALRLSPNRCCEDAHPASSMGSCERERGSSGGEKPYYSPTTGATCRQPKLASRVRLRRTEDSSSNAHTSDEGWCTEAAERLALEVCAQADLREALVGGAAADSRLAAHAWRARAQRLEADCHVLQCALARATSTAHRLSVALGSAESSVVCVCSALSAADRALELYDVLLALQETSTDLASEQRAAAELVAGQLLARLEGEEANPAQLGQPLLAPGPWLQHHTTTSNEPVAPWSAECEAKLRSHCARLKGATVALRALRPPPHMYSVHDSELPEGSPLESVSMAEMEAAVALQDALTAEEMKVVVRERDGHTHGEGVSDSTNDKRSSSRRRRRERHWLDSAETDL